MDGYHNRSDPSNRSAGSWMTGGGLEWRVTPRFGLFAEGRFTWTDPRGPGENAMSRVGLRVAF
jgi:hypothetical protein